MSYETVSRHHLKNAEEAIERGDYLQASEKLWGSAAVMVKAIAESRGWEHNGHASLYRVVRRLADETGDDRLSSLFRIAGQLHVNFYENLLPPEDVVQASGEVKELLKKLEDLVHA